MPITKVFDLDEATRTVKKLFPAKTVIVPLPDEHALLVYMTDDELAELRDILRKCVPDEPAKSEPRMPTPRLPGPLQPPTDPDQQYTMHFKDGKWEHVFAWYAAVCKLKADVQVKPKGTFTFAATPIQRKFTRGEITDIINEELAKQKLLLIPHRKTFAVVSSEGKIDPKLIPVVQLEEFLQFGRTAIVEATIPLVYEANEEATDELKKFVTPVGEILRVKGKSIVVRDTFGNIMRIQEAVRPM